MANFKRKEVNIADDIDIDALLETLSPEELEKLGEELIDPDDSDIPASDRCRYKTDKQPTGPLDREKLLNFLETKAKEEKDWEDIKPYVKEIRGKIWKPKEVSSSVKEEIISTRDDDEWKEWNEALASATEEELVDLAAVLGFHGMLNQVQYHQAFVENKTGEEVGGFKGVAKHQELRNVPDQPPNDTDVDGVLQKLIDNDPEIKEVNLNNIKKIPLQTLCQYADVLKTNKYLERLHMANVNLTDKVAKRIGDALKDNRTLSLLNIESNFVSGDGIIAILEGAKENQILEELRVTNQRPQVIGVKKEMKIAELIHENMTIKKFGIFLDILSARIKVQDAIERNNDDVRKDRRGETEDD